MIKKIQLRTLEGKDLNGQPFAQYSKRYTDSLDFRLADKDPNSVDLRFTHEMMNAMRVASTATGSITIGFISLAAEQKAKWAEADDNGPSRKFFGISKSELDQIVAQFSAPEQATRGLAAEVLRRIFLIGKKT